MKKKILFLLSLLFSCLLPASADPGIGLVKDRAGNLYYTDLAQVWKIATNGERKVVVRGVHTHKLYIDSNDNLMGEHLWYDESLPGNWAHYVWRLQPNGRLDTILGPKNGFLDNYSFDRDAAGNMYYVQHFRVNRFKKITPSGEITTIAETTLQPIGWRYISPDGKLYFVADHAVHVVNSNGQIQQLAKVNTTLTAAQKERHWIGGLFMDGASKLYLANYGSRTVLRLSDNGNWDTVALTPAGWYPSYGIFDNQGRLWVMQYNDKNEVRVELAARNDTKKERDAEAVAAASPFKKPGLWLALVVVSVLLIAFGFFLRKRKLI